MKSGVRHVAVSDGAGQILGGCIERFGPPPGVLNCHQSKYQHQQQLQASRRRNIAVIIPKQILRYRS